ncbi:MAG TPA: hypothetical protein VIG99_20885, partial [Myxococcaceae bacterium]
MAKPRRPLWVLRAPIPKGTGQLLAASSVALVLLVWCVLSYVHVDKGAGQPEPLVPHFFLPPPDEVLRGLLYLMFEQGLASAVGTSILRILKAFALSVAVAVPLGIFMGSFEAANKFFDSILAPMRYLPITAFIPLLILWFGIQEQQKVA